MSNGYTRHYYYLLLLISISLTQADEDIKYSAHESRLHRYIILPSTPDKDCDTLTLCTAVIFLFEK